MQILMFENVKIKEKTIYFGRVNCRHFIAFFTFQNSMLPFGL